jgi:hypothetical protein
LRLVVLAGPDGGGLEELRIRVAAGCSFDRVCGARLRDHTRLQAGVVPQPPPVWRVPVNTTISSLMSS